MKQFLCKRKVLSIVLMLALVIGFVQFSAPPSAYAATNYTAGTYNELATVLSSANDGDTISITADIIVNAQLTVTSSVTINGNGYTISVPEPGLFESGLLNPNGSNFSVFFINGSGKSVTLNDMTLYGGVYGEYSTTHSNRYLGGAIVVNNGTLNLNDSTVSRSGGKSTADLGGTNTYGAGGICNETNGIVFIKNSNFSRNAASYGGAFVNYGKMFIENSTFSENRSLGARGGGGAGQNNGTLYVNNSTFSNNTSTELGGAINDLAGAAYTFIQNSTFTGNVSYNTTYGGGALRGGNTTVINSLFAYNYDNTGGSLKLNDIYYPGSINAYYSIFHGTVYSAVNGSGNSQYTDDMLGSNNTLFAGGSSTKVLAANGTELGIQAYRPFLEKPAGKDTSVIPLLATSPALSGGCNTVFFADPDTPEVGYYDGSTWQMVMGSYNAANAVTTDQLGDLRGNVVGATAFTNSGLHMVKLKYYDADTYGLVSGISIYGDIYMSGASATISTVPNSGYVFSEWKNASDDSTFSASNPYTFSVTGDVYIYPTFVAAPTYSISASALSSFGSLATPYTQPAAQTVTITNTGNQSITLTQPTSTNYIIGALSSTSLPANGSTATFTVQPKANLGVGNHDETITINGDNGAPVTVSAQFAVIAAPTYSISASTLSSFGSLATPYTQPAAQTVTITNTGNQGITLTQPTSTNYIIGALSSTSLPANGSTATFTVQPKANLGVGNHNETITINGDNGAPATVSAQFAVTAAPSGGNETSSTPVAQPQDGANILVNGNAVNAGTAENSIQDGKTVTTIIVDQQKLDTKLAIEGNNAVVTIPFNTDSDKLVGQLNGQMVKDMEEKQAALEVQTGSATYTLPASEINIDAVSAQLGTDVTLSDITVKVAIASPSDQTATIVKSAAENSGFSLVVPATDFLISCTYSGKSVDVSTFNTYVERTVAIPDGVDPAKITTGVVVNPDGTVRHVPTKVTVIDDKYYAVINSLTNSTYTVIWHPIEFSDATAGWAKDSINDMGSRMVVSGVGNNNYAPDRNITRAEFAAIIVRALGLAPETGKSSFNDVEASKWYCGYIKTASEYGIIEGYNKTTFGPNDMITREQAMAMIARAMKITGLKSEIKDSEISSLLAKYSDGTAASTYAKTGIAACLKTGIITGRSSNTIAPKNYITRAEVAVIVQRLLKKSNLI